MAAEADKSLCSQGLNLEMMENLESKPCPLGCPWNDKVLFSGRDNLHNLPGEFTVVRCLNCGLMRTNPRPNAKAMAQFYPDDYGPYASTSVKRTSPPSKLWKLFNKLFYGILFYKKRTFATALPPAKAGRALEIGCASGSFMKELRDLGWHAEGIEFSRFAADKAKSLGFRVHVGSLEDAPNPDAPYDLIVGWMVLEHLHNPLSALKKLHQWLAPDGWLAVSLPNAGAIEFRIFRGCGYALHLPNHLYHFTPKTLENLLENCGWKIERLFHQRVLNNIIGGIGFCFNHFRMTKWLGNFFLRLLHSGEFHHVAYPFSCFLSLIGQTGRMTVWARKKDS